MAAVLRSLAGMSREAEVVGAECCPTCRADDGTIVRIATELKQLRLPHEGCPRGLCACDWWIAVGMVPKKRRRSVKPAPPSAAPGAPPPAEASDPDEPDLGWPDAEEPPPDPA
jgi:hypothetical protein